MVDQESDHDEAYERGRARRVLKVFHALCLKELNSESSISSERLNDLFKQLWGATAPHLDAEALAPLLEQAQSETGQWAQEPAEKILERILAPVKPVAVEPAFIAPPELPAPQIANLHPDQAPKPPADLDPDQDLGWDPFRRVLLSPILPLLARAGGPRLEEGALSRRVVPGFMNAIRLLVGDELLEACRVECNDAMQRLQTSAMELNTGSFWTRLYADGQCQGALQQIYGKLIIRFSQYERRRVWFVRVINGELALSRHKTRNEMESAWEFNSTHCVKTLQAIYLGGTEARQLRSDYANYIVAMYPQKGREACQALQSGLVRDLYKVASGATIMDTALPSAPDA